MNIAPPQEVIRIGQIEIRYLLEGAATTGALALFEVTVPSNVRVPAVHRHITFDETIWAISGTCTFILEGREVALAPGQALFIPRGVAHQFVNRGSETARFLATITPGVLSPDYFREVAGVVNAGGPPDLKRMGEIMLRHGLQPV
jgi:quercetin dioxygenase-like cupin family protein